MKLTYSVIAFIFTGTASANNFEVENGDFGTLQGFSLGGNGPVKCDVEVKSTHTRTCQYLYWGNSTNPFTGKVSRAQSGSAKAIPSEDFSRIEVVDGRWAVTYIGSGLNTRTIYVPTYTPGALNIENYTPSGTPPTCPTLTEPSVGRKLYSKYHPGYYADDGTYVLPRTETKTDTFTTYPSLSNNVQTTSDVSEVLLVNCAGGF